MSKTPKEKQMNKIPEGFAAVNIMIGFDKSDDLIVIQCDEQWNSVEYFSKEDFASAPQKLTFYRRKEKKHDDPPIQEFIVGEDGRVTRYEAVEQKPSTDPFPRTVSVQSMDLNHDSRTGVRVSAIVPEITSFLDEFAQKRASEQKVKAELYADIVPNRYARPNECEETFDVSRIFFEKPIGIRWQDIPDFEMGKALGFVEEPKEESKPVGVNWRDIPAFQNSAKNSEIEKALDEPKLEESKPRGDDFLSRALSKKPKTIFDK